MPRPHAPDSLRPIEIQPRFLENHPATVIYGSGRTKVLCCASLASGVPPFLAGSGRGWATAEYSLLPGSTTPRKSRERGQVSGRTQEIQRLIGRALRGVLDLEKLDGFTLEIDCDVLQADGGTRTAAISGAYVAARLAIQAAMHEGLIAANPFRSAVAAVSVGIVDSIPLLDLCYEEDARAAVDLNVVQDGDSRFLEVQGTAEGAPFSREELDALLDLASHGNRQILAVQRKALETAGVLG